jgi:5'-3' exonuclease
MVPTIGVTSSTAEVLTRKLLLIDGDQFVFTAAVAIERETRWDEDNHVLYSSPELAFSNFEGMLKRIFERFDTDDHALTFSSPNNFRYGIDPTYKSNRKGARKPLCYSAVRELADAHYNTITMEGLEADDIMGILATKPGGSQRIIVSQDKDMKTIPATIWDGKDVLTVSEEEADYNHLYQTLIGDNTDGVKGCPGVGPVKAAKLLSFEAQPDETPHDWDRSQWAWSQVVAAYVKSGLTEADALQQSRLVRILRWTDWNSDTKEPILWCPQNS